MKLKIQTSGTSNAELCFGISRNHDRKEISLYIINTYSNIQVMRIKKEITKDKMSWYLDKFSLLVAQEMYGKQ